MKHFTLFNLKRMLLMFVALTCITAVNAQTGNPDYCEPGYTNDEGKNFETLSNTYVEKITLTNGDQSAEWNYSERQFYNVLDLKVDAARGETVTAHLVGHKLGEYSESTVYQDLRFTAAVMAIDWNRDGEFEYVEKIAGNTPPTHNVGGNMDVLDITKEITVPADAELGLARVRINYTNAWFGNSTAEDFVCTCKEGIVYDFDINVTEAAPKALQLSWSKYGTKAWFGELYIYVDGNKEVADYGNGNGILDVTEGSTVKVVAIIPSDKGVATVYVGGQQVELDENDSYTFTMSEATNSIEVKFDVAKVNLTINKTGEGNVYVTSGNATYGASTQINLNSEFTVSAEPAQGYVLESLEVLIGGEVVTGESFTASADVVVNATFVSEAATTYEVSWAEPDNGTIVVKNGTDELTSPATVEEGTVLTIEANPAEGYTLESLTVNGEDFTSGETYTVTSATTIAATFKEIEVQKVNLTINKTGEGEVYVASEGNTYSTNGQLSQDAEFTVSAEPAQGYVLESLEVLVGGEVATGETYTATADVVVNAVFAEESAEPQNSAIRVPEKDSYHYQFRFTDEEMGEHEHDKWVGSRTHNFTVSAWLKLNNIVEGGDVFGYGQSAFWGADGTFAVKIENGKYILKNRFYTAAPSGESNNNNEANYITTEVSANTEDWVFVTAVYNEDANNRALYINGELAAESEIGDYGLAMIPDEAVFYFSCKDMSMDLDEVQVWKRALGADEVKASMSEVNADDENLIYLYRFTNMNDDYTFNNLAGGDIKASLVYGSVVSTWYDAFNVQGTKEPEFVPGHNESEQPVTTYTVSWTEPENGTLTVMNGDTAVNSGDAVAENTVLTITATPAEGYTLETLTVNGEPFTSGETYTVTSETTIAATFVEAASWELVASNILSATTKEAAEELLEGENVWAYGDWRVDSNGASIELGTTGEENWGPKLSPLFGDYLAVEVDITESGIYKFEFATSLGDVETSESAMLRYSQDLSSWVNASESFKVSSGKSVVESDELELEAGTYYFAYYVSMGFSSNIRVADFKLWRKPGQAVDPSVTLTFEEVYDGGEIRVRYENEFANLVSGCKVKKGERLNVLTWPNEGYELTAINVEGATADPASPGIYVVDGDKDVTVSAEFSLEKVAVVFDQPENGTMTVMAGDQELASNDKVNPGTAVTITVVPDEGYQIKKVTMNDNEIFGENGVYNTTITEVSYIYAEIEKTPVFYGFSYEITEGEDLATIKAYDGEGNELANPSRVEEGTEYTVEITTNVENTNVTVMVNGTAVGAETSGNVTTYSGVVNEKTEITVTIATGINDANVNGVYYNSEEKALYTDGSSRVTVYDLAGRVVLNANPQTVVSVAELADGFYTAVTGNTVLKFKK